MTRSRLMALLAAFCSVLMVAVAGLVIALVAKSGDDANAHRALTAARNAKAAVARAEATAKCVNDALGKRNQPTQKDAAAHIAFAKTIDGLFQQPTRPPTAKQRAAATAALKSKIDQYVRQLVADQANRDSHPLGHC